jgi:hypothetical protein
MAVVIVACFTSSVALSAALTGCSNEASTVSSTGPSTTALASGSDTTSAARADCVPGDPPLRVDDIADAIAAVEAKLGAPQRYYEINATPVLVNLFVASDDGTQATPFVFAGGTLTADAPLSGASGQTFVSTGLNFDPQLVMSCVAAQLPDSTPTAFEIVGGPDGSVRYSVVVTSQVGGQLIVEVAGDGSVLSVDPV